MRSTAVSIGSCGSTPLFELFGLKGQKSAKNRLKWHHNSGWYDIFDINSWRRQLGRPPETNFGTSEVCCAILCRVKGWKMLIFAQKTAKWRNDNVINRLKIMEKNSFPKQYLFHISRIRMQKTACQELVPFKRRKRTYSKVRKMRWDSINYICGGLFHRVIKKPFSAFSTNFYI